VAKLLSRLAIARQAPLSEECVKVYLSSLCSFDLRDVGVAIEKLAIEPRRDFKPAFPDLGELVGCVTEAASRRNAAALGRYHPCGECHEGQVVVMVPGLDKRMVRAFADCQCLIAWRAARRAAIEAVGV
jgi:hypothetical protein